MGKDSLSVAENIIEKYVSHTLSGVMNSGALYNSVKWAISAQVIVNTFLIKGEKV